MKLIENDDAQFMLLAGFIIAIGLVITTVMLSNIIFEGNMASEAGTEPAKYDIVNLMKVTKDEIRSAYRNATEIGGSDENMTANFSKQMRSFNANLPKIYAMHGEGVNVSLDASNWDSGSYANFTEDGTAGGEDEWTLIENVNNSNITVNVTTGDFKIVIENATDEWNYTLVVGYYFINNTNITSHVSPPYSIKFEDGDDATGNYSITGNTTYNRNFIRARDYIFNATLTLSTSRIHANITIPVSVPW